MFKYRMWILKVKWVAVFILLTACVERIHFDIPSAESQIIVEGMISDDPGPYLVKVSSGLNLDADSIVVFPLQNAKIKLYDDEGNTEDLIENIPGEYATKGIIQGRVGHSYHIILETSEGKIFQSEPDKLNPVGEIQSIRYEYEARAKEETFGEVRADVFNIYLNSYAGSTDENYVRWRYTGIFKASTNPELYWYWALGFPLKDPWPCSGYIVVPAGQLPPTPPGSGRLEKISECTCCTCYVSQFETIPQLSDGQFVSDNQYKDIKVAEVSINGATFFDKYLVEIEQMSLSKSAFDFFKIFKAQKESSSSLFQPKNAQIKGNLSSVNSNDTVIGLFWATSIKRKSIFIPRIAVPYTLPPTLIPYPCDTYYSNATTTKPANWNE